MEKFSIQQIADKHYSGNVSSIARDNDIAISQVHHWKSQGRNFIQLWNGRYVLEAKRIQILTTPLVIDTSIDILHFPQLKDKVEMLSPTTSLADWIPNSKKVIARWIQKERICYRLNEVEWLVYSNKSNLLSFQ